MVIAKDMQALFKFIGELWLCLCHFVSQTTIKDILGSFSREPFYQAFFAALAILNEPRVLRSRCSLVLGLY